MLRDQGTKNALERRFVCLEHLEKSLGGNRPDLVPGLVSKAHGLVVQRPKLGQLQRKVVVAAIGRLPHLDAGDRGANQRATTDAATPGLFIDRGKPISIALERHDAREVGLFR